MPATPSTNAALDDELDLDHWMRDPTPEVENEDEGGAPPTSDVPSSDPPSPSAASSSGNDVPAIRTAYQNDKAFARSLANKARLHPYQRQASENIVGQSAHSQIAQLLVAVYALENKVDSLVTTAPPFRPGPELMCNIKSFITAVLLSAKLGAYKGFVPRDHVITLVLRDRLHLPKNFDQDPAASKALKEAISDELSQVRSRLKKQLKANIELHVFDLAALLIGDSACKITVPLCGRVALFRQMYKKKPGKSFWDAIDRELQRVRTRATDEVTKVCNQSLIDRFFKNLLVQDQKTYTGDTTKRYVIPEEAMEHIQVPVGGENLGSSPVPVDDED